MSLPRIAIVGRPNVGKSSLLNMLAKERVSIVDSTPGVTRDRVAAVIELIGPLKTEAPKLMEVIDTGGFGVYTAEGARFNEIGEDLSKLSGAIEAQIEHAVRTSDLILFVVDAQAGITALDQTFAQVLREKADRADTRVLMVANKVDAENWEPYAAEASALGFGEPMMVSAQTKYMRRNMMERLYAVVPVAVGPDDALPEMKIAIIGKRNAGKSTLVNALAGEERVIVSEIAGTTRDAIDVRFEMDGRTFVAIDTAGVRRRKSIPDRIEFFAQQRSIQSIDRADVVLLIIDATEKVSKVDKQLCKQILDRFKPCIIIVNKWDLAENRKDRKGQPITPEHYREYLAKEMVGLNQCPIVFTTATEKKGVADAVELAFELFEQSRERVSTSTLNRIFEDILTHRGPTSKLGKQAKIYYVSQVAVAPPTIVLKVNDADLFTPQYERYLLNRLAERTPFEEVPIRLLIRGRAQEDRHKPGQRRHEAVSFTDFDDDDDASPQVRVIDFTKDESE